MSESQREAAYRGITSVPCYVIDRRFALVGAQPVEVLARAISRAQAMGQAV